MSLAYDVNMAIINCLDSNKDGFISYDKWLIYMRLLNFGSTEEMRQMFVELDTNGDGKLNREQFDQVNKSFFLNVPGPDTILTSCLDQLTRTGILEISIDCMKSSLVLYAPLLLLVTDEMSHNSYNTSQVDESCTLLHWIQCNILYDNKIYHC